MSENATEALTITRSIGLVRLALASLTIAGLSLFPLLLPHLPLLLLSQGCGWLLPASIPMSDALWRLHLPRHRRTSRGTVAQSDVWAPVRKDTRTSARDFLRSQGAHRLTPCRGPERATPSGFDTHTKPTHMLRCCQVKRLPSIYMTLPQSDAPSISKMQDWMGTLITMLIRSSCYNIAQTAV